MFELIYPSEPAPVVAVKSISGNPEMLPVVEASGLVTAQTTRAAVHGGSRLLHPVVHLHIVSRMGEIFLQKRSRTKDLYPGLWDTAVGGHVNYGEHLEEALFREAGEELSLFDFNPIYMQSYVFDNQKERELVNVFATLTGRDISPDNDEVEDGRYWTTEEIESAIGTGVLTPNFEQEYVKMKDSLLALL